jgi:hypothetical protein
LRIKINTNTNNRRRRCENGLSIRNEVITHQSMEMRREAVGTIILIVTSAHSMAKV